VYVVARCLCGRAVSSGCVVCACTGRVGVCDVCIQFYVCMGMYITIRTHVRDGVLCACALHM